MNNHEYLEQTGARAIAFLLTQLQQTPPDSRRMLGYFYGKLDAIEIYMEAPKDLCAVARKEIDRYEEQLRKTEWTSITRPT